MWYPGVSYVEEKNPAEGRVYEVLGLVAALRVNGQMPTPLLPVGLADGLGGRAPPRVRERRADKAADEV